MDSTQGPVYLFSHGDIILRNSAKIRNIRTDYQLPKVGDLRIIQVNESEDSQIALFDSTCIEHAFLFTPEDDFQLLTTAGGCAGEGDRNVIGVVWAEDIINSTNSPTSRTVDDGVDDIVLSTPMVRTGIEIPDDVSSLGDALESVNLPVFYSIQSIHSWSTVAL